jgi:uncharacterized cupredoxin-like copper-binding protein
MRRGLAGLVVLVALGLGGLATGVLAASGSTGDRSVTKVTVTATEFRFVLSRRSVPTGTVVFTVVNAGKLSHDFEIGGRRTPLLAPGRSATLRVTFGKKGRYAYRCTVGGHAAAGMKGVLVVAAAPMKTVPPPLTATTTSTAPSTTVTVSMVEYRFDLSQTTVPAGKVTFVVRNDGRVVHNFDLVGVMAGAFLQPGESETWTVSLAPKTYAYRCDVPQHAAEGMKGQLTATG